MSCGSARRTIGGCAGIVGAYWEDFDIKDDMNFLYKTIPSCTPANLALCAAGGPACVGNVDPARVRCDRSEPAQRQHRVRRGPQRGYKQTAFFTSVDYDLIPKVLTVTGGTR